MKFSHGARRSTARIARERTHACKQRAASGNTLSLSSRTLLEDMIIFPPRAGINDFPPPRGQWQREKRSCSRIVKLLHDTPLKLFAETPAAIQTIQVGLTKLGTMFVDLFSELFHRRRATVF